MNERQMKYLEMVQAIINRMASNSFMIKGWSITLVSALFALAAKDSSSEYVIVSYFPVVMFWTLDAYFLHQERLFRRLFDKARTLKETDVDFSMNTKSVDDGSNNWLGTAFSKTLLLFHGVVFFTVCIVMFALRK